MSIDKYTGVNCIRTYPLQYTTSTLRFTDKENNECERELYSNYWREQLSLYGQKTMYYVNLTNTLCADNIYGEQPLAGYRPPQPLVMAINLSENALVLSKFGFQSDDFLTAYVHISSFYEVFPLDLEPKAGDVFQLTEYGSDRPGERDGKMFQITERLDQDINKINPLLGHYVWLLKAKRFEYSFEPGLTAEKGNTQVFDNPKDDNAKGATKNYTFDINTASKQVFDGKNNTSVYGEYD